MPITGNMGPRIGMLNPMANPAFATNSIGFNGMQMWPQQVMQPGMINPQQFMIPTPPMNADPNFLAAHQQAMLIAKQTYQMAVAQQAMAAAADEWERSSNIGGMSSMGSGSVYGGVSMAGGWGPQLMFPSAPRSMYAGSVFGESDAGGGWGSASVYGESFGPSLATGDRRSQAFRGSGVGVPQSRSKVFPRSESSGNLAAPMLGRPAPRPRTKTAPSGSPLPLHHSSQGLRNATPPTSWKTKI